MKHFPHSQHVYLAGGIEGLTYEEATTWRNYVKSSLIPCNIDCLDPTRRTSFIENKSTFTLTNNSGRIFKSDLQDIHYSSVILADLRDSMAGKKWGTVCEIAHAHTKNKIIICIMDADQFEHPFIVQYATEIHHNINSAIEAVKEYYI